MTNIVALGTDTALEKERNSAVDFSLQPGDKERLRELAKRLRALAEAPSQGEKRRLWKANNDLKPVKPMILCDPENGWQEILFPSDLKCKSPAGRNWELSLLKEIFWAEEMGDDRVVDAAFSYSVVSHETDCGMSEKRERVGDRGSFTWEPPLKDYKDLKLLHDPVITVDRAATAQKQAVLQDCFGDILRVYQKNYWWWSLGLTYQFVLLRGLENLMFDLYDYPDEVHALMKFLSDSAHRKLDFLQQEGLLSLNSDNDFIGSHSHGFTADLPAEKVGNITPMDMWGFCESQETVSVSPEMFAEFVFPYQLSLAERFGLNYYGCCEPLHSRFHIIKQIPRLRKLSVSPWANIGIMGEQIGKAYVMSIKPNPAYVAQKNPDWARVRQELKHIFKASQGTAREIILKDLNTIGANPEHVKTWCRIAQEEAQL